MKTRKLKLINATFRTMKAVSHRKIMNETDGPDFVAFVRDCLIESLGSKEMHDELFKIMASDDDDASTVVQMRGGNA